MSWSMMTALIGCSITGYLFFRYAWCLNLGLSVKAIIFLMFMFAGCLPLFNSYDYIRLFGDFYALYRHMIYAIFIFCVLLFSITLFADLIVGLVSITTDWLRHLSPQLMCRIKYGYIALAFFCTLFAAYSGLKVPDIKELSLHSDKLTTPLKIVVLTDVHLERTVKLSKIQGIVEKTNAQNPDVILLVGDIIDDRVAAVASHLDVLKGLKAAKGVYFATGNHEFYRNYQATTTALQKQGFKFLENSGVKVADNLVIGGVPDTSAGGIWGLRPDLARTFSGSSDRDFRILMVHTPTDFGDRANFDLEVSGHTHGGQIFPFHLLVKMRHRYLAGLYPMSDGKTQIYVSRGAGQWGPQLRFFAPSEITLLNLRPKE